MVFLIVRGLIDRVTRYKKSANMPIVHAIYTLLKSIVLLGNSNRGWTSKE